MPLISSKLPVLKYDASSLIAFYCILLRGRFVKRLDCLHIEVCATIFSIEVNLLYLVKCNKICSDDAKPKKSIINILT